MLFTKTWYSADSWLIFIVIDLKKDTKNQGAFKSSLQKFQIIFSFETFAQVMQVEVFHQGTLFVVHVALVQDFLLWNRKLQFLSDFLFVDGVKLLL